MAEERVQTELNDELVLKLWDGDESAKGELIRLCAGKVEVAIQRRFPTLAEVEVEDVVAEAIRRFWEWRKNYDPETATLRTVIYGIAYKVACEFRSGRYKWQKIRFHQVNDLTGLLDRISCTDTSDGTESDQDSLHADDKFLADTLAAFNSLPPLQQDILRAYADAGEFELDAGDLGKELGIKHKSGVPIPASTIRVNKSRAKSTIKKKLAHAGHDLRAKGYHDD